MKFSKWSRKIFAVTLAVCMTFGCVVTGVGSYIGLSTTVNAAETTANGFEYDTNDDGTIKITGYNGSDISIVIPSKIDGKIVTGIEPFVFGYGTELSKKIISVTIQEGVTYISTCAFYGCQNLTNLVVPNSVESIGVNAFDGTAWYNNQPDGLNYIGKIAYYKGNMLKNTSIEIEEGTLGIYSGSFSNYEELISIDLPDSIVDIGDFTFLGCTNLASISLPSRVTAIYYKTFANCTGLTNIIIPNSVTKISSEAFYGCTKLKSIIISDSVKEIGAYAFDGCNNLTIYGNKGSYSETYANENNIPFVDINTLANNSTISKTTINYGDALTITGKATGATSPYQYSFLCKHSTETKWTTLTSYGTTSKRVWQPKKTGTYTVRSKIKDAKGKESIKDFTLTVNPALANNSTMNKTTINFGDALTITGNATDGTAPYKYSFLCKHSTETKWTTLTSYGTTSKRVWQPKKTGTYTVRTKVKDATGKEVIKDFTLTVNPALVNNSTMNKTTINFGDSLTITGKAANGTSPYQYSFLCKHSTVTSWTTLTSYGTTSTRVWKPTKSGTYTVRTKVKDATGKEVIKDFTLTVK